MKVTSAQLVSLTAYWKLAMTAAGSGSGSLRQLVMTKLATRSRLNAWIVLFMGFGLCGWILKKGSGLN